jgi:hypothetical protein
MVKHAPLVLAVTLLAGCPDRSLSNVDPQQQGATTKDIPVSADIDVLFVIDNSGSTQDKQTIFAQNFPRFVQALDAFPTGRPNLHIAVIDSTVDIGVSGYGPGCPSPDPADDGRFQSTARVPGCTPPTGKYLSDIKAADGTRQINYSGTLDGALSCIAQVGANGCGFEAPLEAMKRALDGSHTENSGFLRPGAYLAVIFLTDEDDASVKDGSAGNAVFSLPDAQVGGRNDFRVQPLFAYLCDQSISASGPGTYTGCKPRTDSYLQDPGYFAQFLNSVKSPGQLVVAVIAAPPPGLMTNDDPPQTATSATDITIGPVTLNGNTQPLALQPSCSATINNSAQIGRPAVRLASFLSNYGSRGRFYTVCQSDYSAALTDIGKTLFNAISPCLEGPVDASDADPNNPGTQLQCTVTDVQDIHTNTETRTLIPACKMQDATTPAAGTATPCWYTDLNQVSCPAPDTGYEINIDRGSAPPAPGTTVEVECAVTTI